MDLTLNYLKWLIWHKTKPKLNPNFLHIHYIAPYRITPPPLR